MKVDRSQCVCYYGMVCFINQKDHKECDVFFKHKFSHCYFKAGCTAMLKKCVIINGNLYKF